MNSGSSQVQPLLYSLGVTIHPGKSDFTPRHRFTFLGFDVDMQLPARVAPHPDTQRLLSQALERVPNMDLHRRERLARYVAFVLRTLRLPTGLVSAIMFHPEQAPSLAPAIAAALWRPTGQLP